MTDQQLTIAAAEKVLGIQRWTEACDVGDELFKPVYAEFTRGIIQIRQQRARQTQDWTWVEFNPMEFDADAFMLVDAIKAQRKAAFVLGSNGCADQWSAWLINGIWSLGRGQNDVPEYGDPHLFGAATADTRRRAIVLACLRAKGVEC